MHRAARFTVPAFLVAKMRPCKFTVAIILVAAFLFYGGCDSGPGPVPELEFFEPASSLPPDTLVIGEPFRVRAVASSSGRIDGVELILSYLSGDEGALLMVNVENTDRSQSFAVDTQLVVPANAQPWDVVGRPAWLTGTVLGEGATTGVRFQVVLAAR